mmetsp:Transcript_24409/g.37594  ORF Transcript_24409/g.37594 Transcript_24409/m.37594 type:complete len:438 (+) Transcript_24409:132-1445(+)
MSTPALRRSARSTKGIPRVAFGDEESDSSDAICKPDVPTPSRAVVAKREISAVSSSRKSGKRKSSKSLKSPSSKRKRESLSSSQSKSSSKKGKKDHNTKRQTEQDQAWCDLFERCRRFKKKKGHTQVPYRYEKDPELGTWVTTQRRKKSSLSLDRVSLLDSIGFEWKKTSVRGLVRREHWEDMFARLEAYKEEYGDCLVPKGYQKDRHLVKWVTNQRTDYRKDRIEDERKERLEAIGFKWNVYGDRWNEMFDRLKEYKAKYGDCMVPVKWTEDTKLGRWVIDQRHRKFVLSDERISKLDSIGFTWKAKKWDDMYERLLEYKLKYGDCLVPQYCKEDLKLGTWVIHQRSRKSTLSGDRIERLDAIGFAWRVQRGRKAYFGNDNSCGTDEQHNAGNGEMQEEHGTSPSSFPAKQVATSVVPVHFPAPVTSMPPCTNEHG